MVKTRLQVSGEGTRNYKSLGIGGTVKVIATEEGVCCLFSKYFLILTIVRLNQALVHSGRELVLLGFERLHILPFD